MSDAGQQVRCEVRVRGRLGEAFLENFESLEAETSPVESVIHGAVRDRAELYALLDRLELYGIELVQLLVSSPDAWEGDTAVDDVAPRRPAGAGLP